MGYIKFVLKRTSDEAGNTCYVRISRMESDMTGVGTYELNLIMHALSALGGKVEMNTDFLLDTSRWDNDILG